VPFNVSKFFFFFSVQQPHSKVVLLAGEHFCNYLVDKMSDTKLYSSRQGK
jgi:hypothetical protein